MNNIFKLTAILVSIVLIVGIAGCGGKSKTSKSSKSKSVIQEASAQESNPVSAPVSTASTIALEPEDIPVNLRILPTNEFGREDPFIPLAVATAKNTVIDSKMKSTMIAENDRVSMAKATIKKVEAPVPQSLPSVRLSLVIDGSTAIFDDNKASKVASVGDTVSGMKVLEIRGNEAVLGSGSKKYIVSQGGIREDASTPVPVPVQNNNTPKDIKNKKK
jgi:hypothetical protein